MEDLTTEYLKRVWDHMGNEDGRYGGLIDNEVTSLFIVEDGGHTVNGLFMDDVYHEMCRRGESWYVAV